MKCVGVKKLFLVLKSDFNAIRELREIEKKCKTRYNSSTFFCCSGLGRIAYKGEKN